jgi:hypothetical protein
MTDRDLGAMSAETVARLALDDHGWFKRVGRDLASRPRADCAPAVAVLLDAHRLSSAPAWLVAFLLGVCRNEAGYATCLALLEAGGTQLVESYSSHALVQIAGTDARGDLVRVIYEGAAPRTRKAAFLSLMKLGSGGDDVAFIHSVLAAQRVRAVDAAWWLAELVMTDDTALAWLASEEPRHRQAIVDLAVHLVRGKADAISVRRARALLAAIDGERALGSPGLVRSLQQLIG